MYLQIGLSKIELYKNTEAGWWEQPEMTKAGSFLKETQMLTPDSWRDELSTGIQGKRQGEG